MDILLQIVAILILAKVFGELGERLGYPSLIGEVMAGIVLGPSLFNLVSFNPTIELFSTIGIISLLFISGVEVNLRSFIASEIPAASTAFGGVVLPFIMGVFVGSLIGLNTFESLFLGIALSITSIGISVRALIDLKKLNSAMGTTIVGAAVFDDIAGILLLAVLTAFATGEELALMGIAALLLATVLFFILVLTVGRRVIVWLFTRSRYMKTHEMTYSVALIIALFVAFLSNAIGLHYAIGAFLAGLILGDQIRSDRMLFDSLLDFGFGFFVTIFFASIGLLFTFSWDALLSPLFALLIAISLLSKLIGGYLGSILFFKDNIKALIVGLGLYPRGEIALVIAKVVLLSGIISATLYSAFTLVVIVSILVTPVLLKWGFTYLERKDKRATGARPPSSGI